MAAEGRTAVAEEKPHNSSSADIVAGPEVKDGTPLVESGAQMEPVLVVANITEASNNVTTTEPIKVLAKAELLDQRETQKSPLVSVVPPANATEPITLVAKVPAGKPLEIHANVPLNTPVKVITEVAPEIPDVAIVVHRGCVIFYPVPTMIMTVVA